MIQILSTTLTCITTTKCVPAIILAICIAACSVNTNTSITFSTDDDTDSNTDPATDAGPDTGTNGDTETGTQTDTELLPGGLGDPCWVEILKPWHPNKGYPDCQEAYKCIGDSDEAWCTMKCSNTGAISSGTAGIEDWCCGELTEPCDPQRYWLPQSMSFACIPQTAALTATCDRDSTFTGDNERCAPVCSGTEVIHKTVCAQTDDTTFCTYPCDITNNDIDCLIQPEFEGGCCGEIMNQTMCLIPKLCP